VHHYLWGDVVEWFETGVKTLQTVSKVI